MDCEFPLQNATDEEARDLLASVRSIAVVGLSSNPDKASHQVARYLLAQGYRVYAVNPSCTEVLGLPCYPDLAALPESVDLVDVFRPVEALPDVVDQAIATGAGAVWMQLGLVHNAAADKARAAGLRVVMNKCTKVVHLRLPRGG